MPIAPSLDGQGRLLKRLDPPETGRFVPPAWFRLERHRGDGAEIFGPVLHVATFDAEEIDAVVDAVNAKGYGLTFGLHTRVDARVQQHRRCGSMSAMSTSTATRSARVVGSQPFGGEGSPARAPRPGGPHYVPAFMTDAETGTAPSPDGAAVNAAMLQEAIEPMFPGATGRKRMTAWRGSSRSRTARHGATHAARALGLDPLDMPGPTGESNRLEVHPRGLVLCLGPDSETALAQAMQALALGNGAVVVAPGVGPEVAKLAEAGAPVAGLEGTIEPDALAQAQGFDVVASAADERQRSGRSGIALARRDGMLVPLVTERVAPARYILERHLCIDTTAAGGNATLIAAVSE